MSTARSLRTPAIVILLGCASTGVALPLYQEELSLGSGPPRLTFWAGWPLVRHYGGLEGGPVEEAPAFWLLPVLASTASVLILRGRRRPAAWILGVLLMLLLGLGVAGKHVLRSEAGWRLKVATVEAGPGPAFYPVGAVVALALILVMMMPEKNRG